MPWAISIRLSVHPKPSFTSSHDVPSLTAVKAISASCSLVSCPTPRLISITRLPSSRLTKPSSASQPLFSFGISNFLPSSVYVTTALPDTTSAAVTPSPRGILLFSPLLASGSMSIVETH